MRKCILRETAGLEGRDTATARYTRSRSTQQFRRPWMQRTPIIAPTKVTRSLPTPSHEGWKLAEGADVLADNQNNAPYAADLPEGVQFNLDPRTPMKNSRAITQNATTILRGTRACTTRGMLRPLNLNANYRGGQYAMFGSGPSEIPA